MVEHIAKAEEALEGGHNFVLNEVRISLKSMCFRQDGSGQGGGEHVPNVRGPLQVALAEAREAFGIERCVACAGAQGELGLGFIVWAAS